MVNKGMGLSFMEVHFALRKVHKITKAKSERCISYALKNLFIA
jgi:hypothetical protein